MAEILTMLVLAVLLVISFFVGKKTCKEFYKGTLMDVLIVTLLGLILVYFFISIVIVVIFAVVCLTPFILL